MCCIYGSNSIPFWEFCHQTHWMLTEDGTHKKRQQSLETDIKGNAGGKQPGLEEARKAGGRQGHPTQTPDKAHPILEADTPRI